MMRCVSLAILLAGAQPVSGADLPGDPAAGGQLARDVCATCHVVSAKQPMDPGVGAPSFLEVAGHPSVTTLSLRAFLQTPHATMPDLILTPDETDDIISYILKLKEQ